MGIAHCLVLRSKKQQKEKEKKVSAAERRVARAKHKMVELSVGQVSGIIAAAVVFSRLLLHTFPYTVLKARLIISL